MGSKETTGKWLGTVFCWHPLLGYMGKAQKRELQLFQDRRDPRFHLMFWHSPFAGSECRQGLEWLRGSKEVLQEHWLTALSSHTVCKPKSGVPNYTWRFLHLHFYLCPSIKYCALPSLFHTHCAYFAIMLFGSCGMSAWTFLALWRRLPKTEHNRQAK